MLKLFMAQPCNSHLGFQVVYPHRMFRLLGACMLMGILTACAQPSKPMYNWQSYQPAVYDYLKDEDSDYAVQAQSLEQNIEIARAANQALPPGFHAHLGMLYLKLGKGDKAAEQLLSEKQAFPEGTLFMDFLLRNTGVANKQGDKPSLAPDSPAAGKAATTTMTSPVAQDTKEGT
jgi:hypothetical protein